VDHDGRQKISFALQTNATDQCLMAVKVNFWGENVKRRLIVATDVGGKLELQLETQAEDEPVLVGFTGFDVADNLWRRINLSQQRGKFKLRVDDAVTSNVTPEVKAVRQITFLQEPIELCGEQFLWYTRTMLVEMVGQNGFANSTNQNARFLQYILFHYRK
jgi:hypothetical protein